MKRKSKIRFFGLFVSLPLSLLLLVMAFSQNRSRQIEAHKDLLTKSIGALDAAVMLYAQEHGNRLPPANDWEQALQPNTGPIPLELPRMPGGAGVRIAMNRALAGRQLEDIAKPAQAILFFESTATSPSACDALTSLVPTGDPSPLLFGFADGHIEEILPVSQRPTVLARNQEACKTKLTQP